MRKIALAVAVLIVAPAFAQEVKHAPTLDQCRADYHLWFSKLENPHGTDAVTDDVLGQWYSEMGDCTATDSAYEWHYVNAQAEICAERQLRMRHFLMRRNLIQQYVAEDEAGAR
jgi:hypothetical protein